MTTRRWVRVCSLKELTPGRGVAALVGSRQVAVFLLGETDRGEPLIKALDNTDPTCGANVLARGIVGSMGEVLYVASPMHKHRFDLESGACLDGVSPGVRVWPVRVWGQTVEVLAVEEDQSAPKATKVRNHCPYCALGCAVSVAATPDSQLEQSVDASFPVNQGRLCIKGWSSPELLRRSDRLLQPLVRSRDGQLRAASWDAALDELAGRLRELQQRRGPDALAVFGSGALSNEKAYLLGKFARLALGTSNVDYNGRFCMSAAASASNLAFGLDRGLPFPLADISRTRSLTLWGANPADTMPPLMAWVEKLRQAGGRVMVVDPRRSATAESADFHLQPRPGSDRTLAVALLRLAVLEGRVDRAFVDRRTEGFGELERAIGDVDPDRSAQVAGVSSADLRRALDHLAVDGPSILLSGRGPEQQCDGTDASLALINLMLALGKVGRPFSGYGCLTGQGNGQGGREHGQKADQLPGYRSIEDQSSRESLANFWGVPEPLLPRSGLRAMDLLGSLGQPGGVEGLLVFGSNLVVAAPASEAVVAGLKRLSCLAVADCFPNETTELAHFVLPVRLWAEEDGTFTNLEGRVLLRRRVLQPPPKTMGDLELLCQLAKRLGKGQLFASHEPQEVFAELAAASAGARADYSGISYERLERGDGLFWPCPQPHHPGTPRVFEKSFAHPDGRARFWPVTDGRAGPAADPEYPLVLTTGRYREHYNSGSQTRGVERLASLRPEPTVEVHPTVALQAGIADGSMALVSTPQGSAVFRAKWTEEIRADTIFVAFHFAQPRSVNVLTSAEVDPRCGMPAFKSCPARIGPSDATPVHSAARGATSGP